jgi:hypothetical protein
MKIKERIKNKTRKVFAQWLIDVSKYLATGIVISTAFRDVSHGITYLVGVVLIGVVLSLGLFFYNKIEEEEKK